MIAPAFSLTHELLTREQERSLIHLAKAGDDAALETLIRHNERLIWNIANRYMQSGACGDAELDDLRQFGRMGFVRAVEKFDLTTTNKLSTYATYWIRQFIVRHGVTQGSKIRYSFKTNEQRARLIRKRAMMTNTLKRAPTVDELAAACDMDRDFADALLSVTFFSLDKEVDSTNTLAYGREVTSHDRIPDPLADTEADALDGAMAAMLSQELDRLDDRQREIIIRRWGLGGADVMTYDELSKQFHISKQRVQQIEMSVITIIREEFRKKGQFD